MGFINLILIVVAAYIILGFLFALIFVFRGVNRIDESASRASWGFRIFIIPGTIIFWPLLLKKWVDTSKKPTHD